MDLVGAWLRQLLKAGTAALLVPAAMLAALLVVLVGTGGFGGLGSLGQLLSGPQVSPAERLASTDASQRRAVAPVAPADPPAPARPAAPAAPAKRVVPAADPVPTPGRLSSGEIKTLAAQHGAPASLAAAIAWQESGFNNAMVSSANARGIMQVMPGTWDWVNKNLSDSPLDPQSASDNVRAGSLYLAQLLRQTGGDRRLAAAGYYQGLSSVRARGMFDDTKRYVDNVLSLSNRFGG